MAMAPSSPAEAAAAPAQQAHADLAVAARGGGLTFMGRLFEYGVRFAFSIVVARAIGAEQFGLYTIALMVATLLSTLAMLGLQTGLVRFLPPAIHQKDTAQVRGLLQVSWGIPAAVSVALGLGLFAAAGPLSTWVFAEPRLAHLLRLACWWVPLETLCLMAYVMLISYKRADYTTVANNLVQPTAKLLLAVGAIWAGYGVGGVVVSQAVGAGLALGVLLYYANRMFPLAGLLAGPAQRQTGRLLRYSLPVHLGWMISAVRGTLETLILGMVGLTAGAGVFAAAARLSSIGQMFYISIGNISTPIIADLHQRGEKAALKHYYQTTTRWIVTFNLPLFLTFFIFAQPLLALFGEDFATGRVGLMILSVGTLAYTATGLGANTLDMTDHPRVNMVNSILMVMVTIGLDLAMIPRWGVVGAALAASLASILLNIASLLEVWALVGMQPYNRTFVKPVLAALAAGAAGYGAHTGLHLPLLLQLAAGGAALWGAYALALLALGLPEEDRTLAQKALGRVRRALPARAANG